LGYAAHPHRVGHNRHRITECRACGLSFSDPLPTDAELATFYARASTYADVYGQADLPWQRRQHDIDLRRLLHSRQGRPGRLLDVGCSCGLLLEVASELGWDVYGVEPSHEAAAKARERVGESRVFQGFVQELPDDWGPFDAISMSHVWEHFTGYRAVLDGLVARLRPGGVLTIQSPNRRSLRVLRRGPDYRPIEHPYYWTYQAPFRELRRAGLQPHVAPPLLGTGRSERGPLAKETALLMERGLAIVLIMGLKSTLEVHAIKPEPGGNTVGGIGRSK